jgi:ABC-type oligopeptide transport system ATPase subunit
MKILNYIKYFGIILLIGITVFFSVGVYRVYCENKKIKEELQVYRDEISEIRSEYQIYQKNLETYNANLEQILKKTKESNTKIQETIIKIKSSDVSDDDKISSFNETNKYLINELTEAGK